LVGFKTHHFVSSQDEGLTNYRAGWVINDNMQQIRGATECTALTLRKTNSVNLGSVIGT
jgi:hypothetical protein